ncbi:DHH family phosphoesterase [Erysipelatoclostridium sp. AM42-17]|uniref:DHH family phosphoesterase n=1 Tax=Erysipelatoclostridium sp. AM42-17 TaxID=2293102 RepID=UPI000E4F060F|nr:DHH family phosphoesterase [Erysipelatoclostridium sp. AM42-17]RHS95898.1 DHH family phosphoesterase [Erysipelatoclostridium sp. AM42-17]
MVKKLIQLRKILISLLLLEFIFSLLGYLFFKSEVSFFLAVYVFIKNTICILVILYASSVINDANYSVQEALNKETKNALIFGGVGLVKYDENRNIVWMSDLLHELGIRQIGHKLLEWQPLLASLFDDDDVKVIDIESRKYEAYNSKTSRLIFLKDVTDYETVAKEYEDQQLCVAYLTIDNYDESIEYADEQKAASIQSTTRQIILDWAVANGIILKRYKSDGYIAIFNERIYRKQIEDHFRILDDFKNKIEELGEVMALSIGIGRGSTVLRELEEMAISAISMAYSRGGDQVIVKSNNEDIRYFGGNSESNEKINRIRARVIAQSLSALIKQADNIMIMGHKQSDFDSFGASIAMLAISRAYEKKAQIVIDLDSIEEKTKQIATELKSDKRYNDVFVSPARVNEYVQPGTLLISVDNHKPSLAISEALLDMVENKVVIDHHRRGEEFIDLPLLTYLEPAASSAVELIVELFNYLREDITVTEREATIMYAGMLIDTNYFRTRVGSRTFLAAASLRDMQANVARAYEFLQDDYKTTIEKLSISENCYQFGNDILIAYGKEDEFYSRTLLAKAGNELMNIAGIKAVFIVGRVSKETIAISARSRKEINVQIIMEQLGGGGHFSMAACQIKEDNLKNVLNSLEEAINQYLDERKLD